VYLQQEHAPSTIPIQDGSMGVSQLQKELIMLVAGATSSIDTNTGTEAQHTIGVDAIEIEVEVTHASIANWTERQGFDYCKHRMSTYINN